MTKVSIAAIGIPEKLAPLFKPKRYKVVYGGRGGAKSHGCALALLLLGGLRKLRILCAREIQKTIGESVHQLLKDKISQFPQLAAFYTVTDKSIKGLNGTEFFFTGLRQQDAHKIKSYEGVDIVWVEEAHVVTKRSWDILIPTIRKEGSEIWISFNPDMDTDETWARFVENPPPESWVLEIGYGDNPFFPAVLEMERQTCLRRSKDEHDHIWGGKPNTTVEGAIYANEVLSMVKERRIRPVPYDPMLRVHTIWDLGWNDQTSIAFVQRLMSEVRIIKYWEASFRRLDEWASDIEDLPYRWGKHWLPHDALQTRLEAGGKSTEMILKKLLGSTRVKIVPYIGREDGIRQARLVLPRTYIDESSDSVLGGGKRLVTCLKRYRRAVPTTTNEPANPVHDEYSHGCLFAKTLVMTHRGEIPIDQVSAGDSVWTPCGDARVAWAGPTKRASRMVEVTLSNGATVTATPEHKFFTIKGVLRCDELGYDDILLNQENAPCLNQANVRSSGYRDAFIGSLREISTSCGQRDGSAHPRIARLRHVGGEEGRQVVYDLTVEKHHCYLAGGVLVSNSDVIRYMSVIVDQLKNDDEGPPLKIRQRQYTDRRVGY